MNLNPLNLSCFSLSNLQQKKESHFSVFFINSPQFFFKMILTMACTHRGEGGCGVAPLGISGGCPTLFTTKIGMSFCLARISGGGRPSPPKKTLGVDRLHNLPPPCAARLAYAYVRVSTLASNVFTRSKH